MKTLIQELPPDVVIKLSRADAVALFHSINRVLAIVDDEGSGMPDAGDEAAYDMANAFLCQLQSGLQIEPDPEGLIAQSEGPGSN